MMALQMISLGSSGGLSLSHRVFEMNSHFQIKLRFYLHAMISKYEKFLSWSFMTLHQGHESKLESKQGHEITKISKLLNAF